MEKRVFLAIGLSVAVLIGFSVIFPPPKQPAPTTQGAPAPGGQAAPAPAGGPEVERSQSPAPVAAVAPTTQPLVGDSAEHQVVFENEAVRATFSTRGGVLTSWRVKHYAENGAPLDLVPSAVPAGSQKPFTLVTDDQAVNAVLSQALFKPSAQSIDATRAPATLTLEYRDVGGLTARKVFTFSPEKPYEIGFAAEVTRDGNALVPTIAWGPALGTGRVSSGMTYSPSSQPLYYLDRSEHRAAKCQASI
jgi:YidC/Oxa1 family membrane protein insertase